MPEDSRCICILYCTHYVVISLFTFLYLRYYTSDKLWVRNSEHSLAKSCSFSGAISGDTINLKFVRIINVLNEEASTHNRNYGTRRGILS